MEDNNNNTLQRRNIILFLVSSSTYLHYARRVLRNAIGHVNAPPIFPATLTYTRCIVPLVYYYDAALDIGYNGIEGTGRFNRRATAPTDGRRRPVAGM